MRYALRRLGFFVLTLWVALTLNFLLPRLMPGNPALAMMSKFHGELSPKALNALEVLFGVNTHESLLGQYFSYLHQILTGNFGISLDEYPKSVTSVIGSAIWWTIGLVGITTVLAFILGTGLGIVAAWRRGGKLDSIVPPVFVITSAIPYFWMAMVLVLIFALTLHWFPSQGGYYVTTDTPGLNLTFFQDVVNHAFLPAVALLITTIGTWILTMRNTMITTLAEDYVRMARAKGLPGWRIMLDYAARNAILPNLTGFAMSLGFVVSGAILIEYVFNYPGVGYMLLQAVSGEDYPLMQALFLMITVAVLFAILVADILTALLDPRTRDGAVAMAMPVSGVATETPAAQVPAGHALARVGRAVRSSRKATAGIILLTIFILIALFPGVIAQDSPTADAYPPHLAVSTAHLLGTNAYGQDLFAQVVWGTRNVLIIAFVVGLAATGIAVLIGIAAAYLGGLWDGSLSVLTDVLLVIPLFPLLIVIAAYAHGGTTLVLIVAITLTSWSYTARQLRAQALTLRNRDFLEAARVRGERRLYIIVVEVIPTMTSLIVAAS